MPYFYYGTKEGDFNPMLIRDIELEILPSTQARLYIGKDALGRNIYQDAKPRKRKPDPLLPLSAEKQLTLF